VISPQEKEGVTAAVLQHKEHGRSQGDISMWDCNQNDWSEVKEKMKGPHSKRGGGDIDPSSKHAVNIAALLVGIGGGGREKKKGEKGESGNHRDKLLPGGKEGP